MINKSLYFKYYLKILLIFVASTCNADNKDIVLGFDGLAELSSNLNSFGVSFTGATVLACGGILNCTEFPPYSGRNVIYDTPNTGGIITAVFDPTITGPVKKVSARITGNRNITMTAFDKDNNILNVAQTGGANYVGVGTPNLLVSVESTTMPITSVTFHDSGNTFTIDDFTFSARKNIVILDPGHGQLLDKDGDTLHYQRPATPTFSLHEDDLTLSIANSTKNQLEENDYKVYLTRSGPKAPITLIGRTGCGAPKYDYCNDDLVLRVKLTRDFDKESDSDKAFVSIHTNGSDVPLLGAFKNGTESYFCAGSRDYKQLAQGILDGIVALGTENLGVKEGCDKGILFRMSESDIPNTLVEVAYHSNTYKSSGPTDEERLNDPIFISSSGSAIATAIDNYIKGY